MQQILQHVSVSAIVQVFILYLAIYAILRAAKGSKFGQALMGVGIITAALFAFTYIFHFDVLTILVRGLLFYLAISTVVIFQPEIRRILSQVGAFSVLERQKTSADGVPTSDFIAEAIVGLSARRLGAIFAFERGISLRGYEDSGVILDAVFSPQLLTSIFTPPLPLHDGGVIIRGGRISSAHCVFPVSGNPELASSGMRHRAAVGMSEETDALVIVVSEESGAISVAHNGRLLRYSGPQAAQSVSRWVAKAMPETRIRRNPLLTLLERISKGKNVDETSKAK